MDHRWAAKLASAPDASTKLSVAYDYLRSALAASEKDAIRRRRYDRVERLDHARLDASDQLVAIAEQVSSDIPETRADDSGATP